MKFSTLSKAGFAASVCAALTAMSTGAFAGTLQDTIFAKVEPSARDRMFFRLSYINAHIKTTAKDAYDVTGPVLAKDDFAKYLYTNTFVSSFQSSAGGNYGLNASFENYYDPDGIDIAGTLNSSYTSQAALDGCTALLNGLGTPCGIKAKAAATVGTAALSLGYFFTDQQNWAAEAFLLAAPIKAEVYGDGRNQLNGKRIIETKMLPPIAMLGYYFGNKKDALRPYLGLAASYAVFYDAKATEALNVYQGGSGVGDTTVKVKNVFTVGPFAGLNFKPQDDGWSFGLLLGKLRFKTEATLTTRNTKITGSSLVLKDYGAVMSGTLVSSEGIYSQTDPNKAITVKTTGSPNGFQAGQAVSITTALMCDLARAKYQNNDCNQGTFVRRASTTLDSTMIMFNVSHSF
jgi:outer membrane protein